MQLKRDDRGVTLIELLVVIAILGVIVAPLTAGFIMFLRNTNQQQYRMEVSHDAQIAGAYFSQDVSSIGRHDWTDSADGFPLQQSVEVNAPAGSGISPCGGAGTPTALLRLSWDDPSQLSSPSAVRVAYVLEPIGGGVSELHRIKCVGLPTTPVSDIVLAHNVISIDAPSCSTSCTAASPPQSISITLHIQVTGDTDPPLVVTLTGQRRQT